MENPESLERMLEKSAEGDKASFRALFDHLYQDIWSFVRARVQTRDDALDVLQDVFVDLWSTLRRYKFVYVSDKKFYSFIYVLARRKIARSYMFGRPAVSLEDAGDLVGYVSESERESSALTLLALQALRQEDQEVIRLRYFSGMKFSEIAALLGQNENAVTVRHHRALRRLKQILGYGKEE